MHQQTPPADDGSRTLADELAARTRAIDVAVASMLDTLDLALNSTIIDRTEGLDVDSWLAAAAGVTGAGRRMYMLAARELRRLPCTTLRIRTTGLRRRAS